MTFRGTVGASRVLRSFPVALRLLRAALYVLALLSLGPDPALAQTSGIAGTVTRASDGTPLAGITVNLHGENANFIISTVSAGDGSYSFQGLTTGFYRVIALGTTISGTSYFGAAYDDITCAFGCSASITTPLPVETNQTVSNINFALIAVAQVTGTVTNAATATPIGNIRVELHTVSGLRTWTTTNGSGLYGFGSLAPDTYYIRTAENSSYIDELYNNQPCEPSCSVPAGAPIVVGAGASVVGLNFALATAPPPPANGVVAGTVRSATTNEALPSTQVQVYNSTGAFAGSGFTGSDGSYAFSLAPGTYFLKTALSTFSDYRNRLFNNINCSVTCDPMSGTPVVITSSQLTTVNFLLPLSGQLSGIVTNAVTGAPISGVQIQARRINDEVTGTTTTGASGAYILNVLPGNHFIRATSSSGSFREELYNDVGCLPACLTSAGSPVSVSDGIVTTGINFALNPGGTIAGTVTEQPSGQPVSSVDVKLYTAAGQLYKTAFTNSSGSYFLSAPAGSYFLTASRFGYSTLLYSGIACGGSCAVTSGTPVAVSVATTSIADFQMKVAGTIEGTVRSAATFGNLQGVRVEVYTASGALVGSGFSNSSGLYAVSVSEGTYRVRTRVSSSPYGDELFNELPCPLTCNVGDGTPVVVAGGATTSSIDFSLPPAGSISGTVTSSVTGQGLSGVLIKAYAPDGIEVLASTTSSAAGQYTLALVAGTYFIGTGNSSSFGGASSNLVEVIYANQACVPLCAPTSGTPVNVTAGANTPGIDFTVAPGGMLTGRVTDAGTGQPLSNLRVGLYAPQGRLIGSTVTTFTGDYSFARLPSGNFYLRTFAGLGYVDEVYNGQTLCLLDCLVTSGTAVSVTPGLATTGIDFALSAAPELLQNGSFDNGTTGWLLHATPTLDYLVWSVSGGSFNFTRMPPPAGTANQAVIFQNSGVALGQGTTLVAQFHLGSNGSQRKRISVLIHDADFGDLAVCTFWLPSPTASPSRYAIRMVTTKPWANATISFYAATATTATELLTLDNVSLQAVPGAATARTECIDSGGIRTSADADSADLLVNGNFSSGALAPGWTTFGQIQGQVTSGVFEFVKVAGTPAGVVLQSTLQPIAAGRILTSTFQLGNSSALRKRATVLLHDTDFSDLAACTFWLDPGQPLGTFTMRAVTTEAWASATLSVYPATTGLDPWIRLDNATLKQTPSAPTTGTSCLEPAGSGGPGMDANPAGTSAGTVGTAESNLGAATNLRENAGAPAFAATAAGGNDISDSWTADGFVALGAGDAGRVWLSVAAEAATHTLTRIQPLDPSVVDHTLRLRSWLNTSRGSRAAVQVSADGITWDTIYLAPASDTWIPVELDLNPYRATAAFVRLVFEAVPGDDGEPDMWRVVIEEP